MLTYEDVKREFFARAEENCTQVQLEKMRENFSNYFSIAIMQYKTIQGVEIHAYSSMELIQYWIRQVIYAIRSMRHSTGKSARECMNIMLEEGRIGYRAHYQKRCYLKIAKQIKLEPELLLVRDSKYGISKAELRILWLSFFDKVLTSKQRNIVKSDIAKAKEDHKHKDYLNSSTVRVRYSRILKNFAAYLQIDKSRRLGNLSSVEFLLTLDKMMG
jgi:hypothetical protein